jgi:hypothetical protein
VEGLTEPFHDTFWAEHPYFHHRFQITFGLTCAKYCNHLIRRANLPVYASLRKPSVSLLEKDHNV